MSRLVLALLLLAAPTVVSAAPFKANGVFVDVEVADASGCVRVGMTANHSPYGSSFLFYVVQDVCIDAPRVVVLAEGSGTIPNEALSVSPNLQSARLTVTPGGPGFNSYGLVGVIDVTLRRTPAYAVEFIGRLREEWDGGTIVKKTNGSSASYSATAAGVVFGYAMGDFTSGFSSIGSAKDLYIEVVK